MILNGVIQYPCIIFGVSFIIPIETKLNKRLTYVRWSNMQCIDNNITGYGVIYTLMLPTTNTNTTDDNSYVSHICHMYTTKKYFC